jgi:hypothetical protein
MTGWNPVPPPASPCPLCGAFPLGASWSDGSATITISHATDCPREDAQLDLARR